mmetsp:Transcript_13486/g.31939  ORF Transcript_13486/g.31939 Transcript_13486/m.31939 type:complete len:201 (+) Transcript_13486:1238-1840(+)
MVDDVIVVGAAPDLNIHRLFEGWREPVTGNLLPFRAADSEPLLLNGAASRVWSRLRSRPFPRPRGRTLVLVVVVAADFDVFQLGGVLVGADGRQVPAELLRLLLRLLLPDAPVLACVPVRLVGEVVLVHLLHHKRLEPPVDDARRVKVLLVVRRRETVGDRHPQHVLHHAVVLQLRPKPLVHADEAVLVVDVGPAQLPAA